MNVRERRKEGRKERREGKGREEKKRKEKDQKRKTNFDPIPSPYMRVQG